MVHTDLDTSQPPLPLPLPLDEADNSTRVARISGGFSAPQGRFPYVALLVIRIKQGAGVSVCTGTLIKRSVVLTAGKLPVVVMHAAQMAGPPKPGAFSAGLSSTCHVHTSVACAAHCLTEAAAIDVYVGLVDKQEAREVRQGKASVAGTRNAPSTCTHRACFVSAMHLHALLCCLQHHPPQRCRLHVTQPATILPSIMA